jgi:hypothetical protein
MKNKNMKGGRGNVIRIGILQIKNLKNEKLYIAASFDLEFDIATFKDALKKNSFDNVELQKDWKYQGEKDFEISILNELMPEMAKMDYKLGLKLLESKTLDELQPYGEKGYNEEVKNFINLGINFPKE